MKRLTYPILLIGFSLFVAAIVTTVLAKSLASFENKSVSVPAVEMATIR